MMIASLPVMCAFLLNVAQQIEMNVKVAFLIEATLGVAHRFNAKKLINMRVNLFNVLLEMMLFLRLISSSLMKK